jgi:hypothetical protein
METLPTHDQLSDQAARGAGCGRLLDLEVSEVDALVAPAIPEPAPEPALTDGVWLP